MLPAVQENILTVTQLTAEIRELLEIRYRFVRVSGEISNLKTPFSGHSYFTLKDAGAQLRVVLFKQQKRFVAEEPADGQQVVVFGRISVYEPRGEYQLIADSLESYGIGKLLRDFEILKKRLADRGLFDVERKKPLPPYPRSIVVITSPTGAAIQDFLKIVAGRNYSLHLRVLPVKVQGKEAPAEIAAALTLAQDLHADAIVLCRGGGSIEDLWAFNDEKVAEAIFCSTVPVVTGIGHETDSTIADFCADCRCPTPTGAAERLIPDGIALRRQVSALRERLHLYLDHKVQGLEQRLRLQRHRLVSMEQRCSRLEFRLQLSKERLLQAMHEAMAKRERRLVHDASELRRRLSKEGINLRLRHLEHLSERLHHHINRIIAKKEGQLAQLASLLQGLSPLATLARGYAVVRTPSPRSDGRDLVVETKDVEVGDRVDVYLRDGRLDCLVTDKAPGALAVPPLVPPQPPPEETTS
jgi:exodeoxyribonuclease VII large subunit